MVATKKKNQFPLAKDADLTNKPWAKSNIVEVRRFGHALVVREQVIDKQEDNRILYRLYEPTYEKLPDLTDLPPFDSKRTDHMMMLMEMVQTADGMLYDESGSRFMWPKGIAHTPISRERHELWKRAQCERVREITLAVYPDSEGGYLSSGGYVCRFLGDSLTTYHLDDLVDAGESLEKYVGWKVFHEISGTGTLVKLSLPSKDKYAVRFRMKCGKSGCKRRTTVYCSSGVHKGAYAYVIDPDSGSILADLRNQYPVCDGHAG